jgi:hypothetical protein
MIILAAFLVLYALLGWLRKVQYDSVITNFKDLEQPLKGKVFRANIFSRPYFKGQIGSNEVTIGFTSERKGGKRDIYLYYTLACQSPVQLSIISTDWLQHRGEEMESNNIPLLNNRFLLQTNSNLSQKLVKEIEKLISDIPTFAYILVAETGILMERISTNLIDDTSKDVNMRIIQTLNKLAKKLTKKGK